MPRHSGSNNCLVCKTIQIKVDERKTKSVNECKLARISAVNDGDFDLVSLQSFNEIGVQELEMMH
jgi:hypothetical protein